MTTSPSESDDEKFLAGFKGLLDEFDQMPPSYVKFANAAFSTRLLDAELAEGVEARGWALSGVRSAEIDESLVFRFSNLEVVLEPGENVIHAELRPTPEVVLELEADGVTVQIPMDDQGDFRLPSRETGRYRIVLLGADGTALGTTRWIVA